MRAKNFPLFINVMPFANEIECVIFLLSAQLVLKRCTLGLL
jgi:hypothetical protein